MQTFQFDLSVSRLPRFAKLCLAVHSGGSKQLPLFWVNTNVFDYKAKMKGTSTLHMWPYTQESFLNKIGSQTSNYRLRVTL